LKTILEGKGVRQSESGQHSSRIENAVFIQRRLLDFNKKLEEMMDENRNLEERRDVRGMFENKRNE
jgi:hypothetical protein